MKENHAPILAAHPAVPLPLAVLLQLDAHRADQVQIVQVLAVLHHLHLRQGRLVQIANVAVKIFRHVVVLQAALEPHVKFAMAQIHAGQGLRLWIEINHVCVHEYLNQIFLKM